MSEQRSVTTTLAIQGGGARLEIASNNSTPVLCPPAALAFAGTGGGLAGGLLRAPTARPSRSPSGAAVMGAGSGVHTAAPRTCRLLAPPRAIAPCSAVARCAQASIPLACTRSALYHCNYCHKDISNEVRIKCADCQDFDLCLDCFAVGVEVTPHKNTHRCVLGMGPWSRGGGCRGAPGVGASAAALRRSRLSTLSRAIFRPVGPDARARARTRPHRPKVPRGGQPELPAAAPGVGRRRGAAAAGGH